MKIKWLGHSTFLITSDSGVKIITDPYTVDKSIFYGEIKETADIVTVSHDHFDHNNTSAVKGSPVVLRDAGQVKGISFKAVAAFHDSSGGKQRGKNTIFCFNVDGMNVCHLGDLGQMIDDRQIAAIGQVDILFVPVGGYFTLEPDDISKVVEKIKPKLVLPMHYQTEKISLPLSGIDKFLNGKVNVEKLDSTEVTVGPEKLTGTTKIVVLKPAN